MRSYQNIEIVVSTITFMFLFGYFKPIIMNQSIDSYNIVVTTGLFFLWYYLTSYITNLYVSFYFFVNTF